MCVLMLCKNVERSKHIIIKIFICLSQILIKNHAKNDYEMTIIQHYWTFEKVFDS